MSTYYGYYGARFPRLAKWVGKLVKGLLTLLGKHYALYRPDSAIAKQAGCELQAKLARGETVYLVGIGPSGHNTGVALIAVSKEKGIECLSNHEEERYSATKHCSDFPALSLQVLIQELNALNLTLEDIHCFVASWDYIAMGALSIETAFQHAPLSFNLFKKAAEPNFNGRHIRHAFYSPRKLQKLLDLKKPLPIIGMEHHHNHAYFSYAVSPFVMDDKPVMISVIDGTGDRGGISLYLVNNGKFECLYQNNSLMDSLGVLYGYISATQGGWSFLSSEGRYMGAAAWGNTNRLTNPYYKRLRQLLYFSDKGKIYINRKMAGWHLSGQVKVYKKTLTAILGEPIPQHKMWNPDAVLSVDDIEHSEVTQDRVDKAAALQLVFEDGLFHVIDHLITSTGADRLVLAGGTALNCVANMRLLEHFNTEYYQRYLNQNTYLNVWVPPIPSDAGVTVGAAYQFAMQNGVKADKPLKTPFLCGLPASQNDILKELETHPTVRYETLGNINHSSGLTTIADFMAKLVANDKVIGIYQGRAETGPRALGHRSILANPCNPTSLKLLNSKVKLREKIRPLAPMVTLEAAKQLFHLADGASINNYHAYDYMVLTVPANKLAREKIPAVIHYDGTSRIQIVREENNPLIYTYLLAMGKLLGVEASVNTSLNVGSPIVQTPKQAIEVLFRAKALDGIVMVGAEGQAYFVQKA